MFIIFLAVSIMVRNVLLSRRRRRLLPLLSKEASGPYFTTRVDKDGIILPDVTYSSRGVDLVVEGEGDTPEVEKDHISKRNMHLLNPLELLNIPIMTERSQERDEKIIDDVEDKLEEQGEKEEVEGEPNMTVRSVVSVSPLAAPYQAGRMVSEVWEGRHQLQQLYRYSQIDRLVLPPGYVNQNTWT